MASFFLQPLFSKASSHLICISRTFYILRMKKTETWHCLGRIEVELTLDFESPDCIMPVTASLEVHVVTSISCLIIPSQMYGELHSCSWKWDLVQSATLHFQGSCCPCQLSEAAGHASGRSHRLQGSLAAGHSLPRPQSLGWYFLESNSIIKASVQLLHAMHLPEARLVLVLIKHMEFTLGQPSVMYQVLTDAQKALMASCASCEVLWERKVDKPTFKKIYLLHLGCCFSHILPLTTSSKSLAWASRALSICIPQIYDEWSYPTINNINPKRKMIKYTVFIWLLKLAVGLLHTL